ncbi:MAG: ATP-binding protein [Lachnospiraceae bacterium]|nr:ATP-binding protein [Lachnospiraceae bacterium]
MGIYLNPGNAGFEEIRRDIYVDKSGLISFVNSLIGKPKPLVSFSRPRRFGKSYDANMICAYYDKRCDSRFLFEDLEIAKDDTFEKHLNQYNVITFDVTGFIADSKDNDTNIVLNIKNTLLEELRAAFPGCIRDEEKNLGKALYAVVSKGNAKFVFVIDEWDALFREYKEDKQLQEDYILFLRSLFKNKDTTSRTIAAAYMTGILPIKKYGTESALTDFREFTMTAPDALAPYVGFTEREVLDLCDRNHLDFEEVKLWYDGYSFDNVGSVYSPNSVMQAIERKVLRNYWTSSETYESLATYIGMDYKGLKKDIIRMLGGEAVRVRVSKFQNDMTSFKSKDDVLTLLIHLGYLSYDAETKTVVIPNQEIVDVFGDAVDGEGWEEIGELIQESDDLLDATLCGDSDAVAEALEKVHAANSSILQYNNEAALSSAIMIAYYTARRIYKIVPEFPQGKGFADLVFLPRRGSDKPVMIVELKYDKDADTAIRQIHENRYDGDLKKYFGNLLLVGINYDKDAKGVNAKRHSCVIEKV